MKFSIKVLTSAFLAVTTPLILAGSALAASFSYGSTAIQEIEYLSANLAGRSIGTAKEQEAIAYLSGRLSDFGYTPTLQSFDFTRGGIDYTSANIIAERTGSSGRQIIVGAHYDTAPSSRTIDRTNLEGVNDNSSGVGVLLELAERISMTNPRHTVKFILFGAEEVGLRGSRYYANNMTPEEIESTIVMINMDSLIFGDHMYFNAGRNAANRSRYGRYRDIALDIAAELGIDARTNPGLNPDYPAGTGCCSDLEAFDSIVPVLAAEATNWSIGDLDGYTQTADPRVPGGATWHDPTTDNREFINEIFPGLIEERSRNYTAVFDTFLGRLNSGAISVPEPGSVIGIVLAVGLGGLATRKKSSNP